MELKRGIKRSYIERTAVIILIITSPTQLNDLKRKGAVAIHDEKNDRPYDSDSFAGWM